MAKLEVLNEFFLKFDGLVRQLMSSGAKMEKLDIICHLVITLPKIYDNVVTEVEISNPHSLELDFVKNRLLAEEGKSVDNCIKIDTVAMKTTFKCKCRYCG